MIDMVKDVSGPVSGNRSLLPDRDQRQKLRRRRRLKDNISRWGISVAGFGVVFSLAMIFVYLFWEVMPIFRGATVDPQNEYTAPVTAASTNSFLLERYEQLGIQHTDDGLVTYFEFDSGEVRDQFDLGIPEGVQQTTFGAGEVIDNTTVRGLSDGTAIVAVHSYVFSYPEGRRHIVPGLDFPYGEQPLVVDEQGQPLNLVTIQTSSRRGTYLVATTADGRMLLNAITTRSNLLTGETTVQVQRHELPAIDGTPVKLMLEKSLRRLFVIDDRGMVHYFDVENPDNVRLVQSVDVGGGHAVTAATFLVGTESIVFGKANGDLSQWFLVRGEDERHQLTRIREFQSHGATITAIAPEYTRKGFLVVDESGQLGIHYGTSSRTLFLRQMSDVPLVDVAVSQVNRKLLIKDQNNTVIAADLWNAHPQISFRALWNRVWYENRSEPEYIWQSSSGSDEFEAKFSLVPLTVGTLKAAFYAMLFAIPLAIAGAIYTAYFMTPKLRGIVKPSIEIMEALPTVILGFLAGLWLAPFAENHLPAIFSIFLLMPVFMLLFAYLYSRLPAVFRNRIPDGWEAAMLVPVILLFGYSAVSMSPLIEIWFFDGSMRQWFTDIGITYDQRNALVVGIAMGFAVIPTIFSIAEDAVFTVPRHLTQGSMALGSTKWQTVVGVVLPTASPGIFSAVMMGFGRAVGETMIVLMATGNSPVVNFNIFEGMRTLSANIAVELPETAVGSSHFRVLFLAALVLLTLTFIVNTMAEIIRQRLRERYSNL